MSRIGKVPIEIPEGVKVMLEGKTINVDGKIGSLSLDWANDIDVKLEDNKIKVIAKNDSKKALSLWGLSRSLISNLVVGVSEGFKVILEINGVGYKAAVNGDILTLALGYSHDIKFLIPKGIEIKCPKPTIIEIFGSEKQRVGQIAALIRKLRLPEPYKGKGIKYSDEIIFRKEGKKK